MEPIIQLHEKVNFTAIEIASINENDQMIVLGDDHGTVYTVRILLGNIFSDEFPSFSFKHRIRKKCEKKTSLHR